MDRDRVLPVARTRDGEAAAVCEDGAVGEAGAVGGRGGALFTAASRCYTRRVFGQQDGRFKVA